ncbi:unnamed protein product, partial [Pocillopora meandrina]
ESPCNNHTTPETTVDKILQSAVATGYVHNVSQIKNGKYFDFQLQTKHKTIRAVCFSPPKRKYFSKYSKSNVPVELRKVRIIQYYSNIDFPRVEIPSSVTLATLSSVCVGRLEAKVLHLSPIKCFTVWKTENNSGTPFRPFRHNKSCVMAIVFECSCRGKCKNIF